MKGRAGPSTYDLLSNIHKRVSVLPPAVQKRYNHAGIAEQIAHLKSIFEPITTSSKPSLSNENVAKGSGNKTSTANSIKASSGENSGSEGYSPAEAEAAAKNAITKANPASIAHALGLDIE